MFFTPRENLHYGMNLPGIYRLNALLNLHHQEDSVKDPFLVAVLIAMAQKKRRRVPKPEPRSLSIGVGLTYLFLLCRPHVFPFHC